MNDIDKNREKSFDLTYTNALTNITSGLNVQYGEIEKQINYFLLQG